MLEPPRFRSKGCVHVGPSFEWMAYWLVVAWAAATGHALFRSWVLASFPPMFRHIRLFEFLASAVASLGGVVILGVVVAGVGFLHDHFVRPSSESSASTDTTVQSPEETDS